MRNLFIKLIRFLPVLAMFFTFWLVTLAGTYAQNSFVLSMRNEVQVSPTVFEFDIYLQNTDVSPFELATFQAGITYNSGIVNGGTLSAGMFTLVAGTSELVSAQIPSAINGTTAGLLKIGPKTPPGSGSGTIISTVSPGTRIGRFRFTNTVAFTAESQANLAFTSSADVAPSYATSVHQYVGGVNTALTVTPGVNAVFVGNNPYFNINNWLSTAASTDWGTGTNWSSGSAPLSSSSAMILPGTNQPIAGSGATCSNLHVMSGATVQVAVNGTLTVSGNLDVADDNGLTVKSSAAGTGSLIVNGTVPTGNQVKVQRYVAGWTGDYDGWHFLASPVTSQSISGAFTPSPATSYDFFAWGEPQQQWMTQKDGLNGITTFIPGKGYLVAYQNTDTKEFVGTLNTSSPTVSLSMSGGTYSGWNLLGNPYPSAITWSNGATPNIGAVAQIWNNSIQDYTLLQGGTLAIPAMDGFMVYTTSNGQNFTIPSAKIHSATGWYKTGEQQIKLIAHDLDGVSAKECFIGFNPNATAGFDLQYDAYMLSGFAPKFYSTADGGKFSLNTLPAINSDLVIPFGFEKNTSTNFSIELAQSISGYPVYLLDHKTNTVVNLTDVTTYAFTSLAGDDANRFEIFFKLGVGMPEPKPLSSVNVYSLDHKIVVENVSGETQMDVINVQGQLLNSYEFVSNGKHEVSANYPAGIYMVRLNNGGVVKTMKVFVK